MHNLIFTRVGSINPEIVSPKKGKSSSMTRFACRFVGFAVALFAATGLMTGTAAAQYESWRQLLKQIYQAETGFSNEVDVGVPSRNEQPIG